jgi:hypothetical protein
MTSITLASLRDSETFFKLDDIATIVNGRKKEEVGYFVPINFKKEFEDFTKELEKKKKIEKLKRIAKAYKEDPIGDGVVGDGLI